jgi:energy-coupling factor transport system permease protein
MMSEAVGFPSGVAKPHSWCKGKNMIRDITLGQYYPSESWVHKLDPRIKIIGTFIYIIALFIVRDFIGFGIAAFGLAIVIAISKVPFGFIAKGLKPVFLIIAFTFLINMFMTDGETIFEIAFLRLTKEGLYNAFFMGIRLILLIFGSSVLTLTTKPISLTDGIEYLLNPLKKIGVPAHELAMMMTIALRFIPTLLEETDKIMKAQMARGADFESGNLIKRAKSLVPLLVPLFISAFRIAQDLAMAMEARCYRGGEHRTRLHEMKLKRRDFAASTLLIIFLALIIFETHILWRIV